MHFYCYVYVYLFMFMYFHCTSWHSSATLTEGFPCFFLSLKAYARVKLAKMGHGPHSFKCLYCSVYYLFCVVLCSVFVKMCTVLLSPGGYPITVNKYIISSKFKYVGKTTFAITKEITVKGDEIRDIRLRLIFFPCAVK